MISQRLLVQNTRPPLTPWSLLSITVLVAILVFLFHLPFTKGTYLFDDAADYYRAASGQTVSTYLNVNGLSPIGLYRLRKDPAFEHHPWDYLYSRNDNAALRHFHVPFSFYMMDAVAHASPSARTQRTTVSIVTAATCGLVAAGTVLLQVPVAISILFAILAGVQSRFTEVSVDPTPHSWYLLFAVIALFSVSFYLIKGEFPYLALTSISLGFAFATLEFSLELIISMFLSTVILWVMKKLPDLKLRGGGRAAIMKATLIFLVTTFILWPGGWVHGGYIESYGVLGATVIFKNHAAFGGDVATMGIYDKLFSSHLGLTCLACCSLASMSFLAAKRALSIPSIVFLAYTLVALALGIADHFRLSTYISEFLLFFLVTCAFLVKDTLDVFPVAYRGHAIVIVCMATLAISFQEWRMRRDSFVDRPWLAAIIRGVDQNVPKGSVVLVNTNWETYDLYLPGYRFEPTIAIKSLAPRDPNRCSSIKYALLNGLEDTDAHAVMLGSWPTYKAGRNVFLYKLN